MYADFGLVITTLILELAVTSSHEVGPCSFPREWHGEWYQSGLGQLEISAHRMNKKGACIARRDDYYLVENRQSGCAQCLLIMYRHSNLIQYKESYCLPRSSLDDICRRIRVEAILYTIVRESGTPVPCPFSGKYQLIYNNNSGGFCTNPSSDVRSCACDSEFLFRFRQCTDTAYTHDRTVKMKCLASWKDGSDMLLYGEFSGDTVNSKDDAYRCFIYKLVGTLVYMAMSADATCRGLRSPQDGPTVMELTKDSSSWSYPSCEYPRWLSERVWRDLGAKHVFTTDESRRSLNVLRYNSRHHTQHKYRCIQRQSSLQDEHEFTALTFASDECETKHQCIRINRLQDSVLEIYKGKVRSDTGDMSCNMEQFHHSFRHIVIPLHQKGMACPYRGWLGTPISSNAGGCPITITSSCNSTSQLSISSNCRPSAVELQCVIWWQHDHNTKYLLASRLGDSASVLNCFKFTKKGEFIEFSTDHNCNTNIPYIMQDAMSYLLSSDIVECKDTAPSKMPYENNTKQSRKTEDGISEKSIKGSADVTNQSEQSQYRPDLSDNNAAACSLQKRTLLPAHVLCILVICLMSLRNW